MFQSTAQLSVDNIGRLFEGKYLDRSQNRLQLGRQARGLPFRGSEAELGSDDDARTHLRFSDFLDASGRPALRIAYEI
jgi:hypothetical protein